MITNGSDLNAGARPGATGPQKNQLMGFQQQTQTTGGMAPGVSMTPYSGTQNLIGTQINPTESGTLQNYNGMVEGAAGQVANFQYSPWQSMGPFTTSATDMYGAIQPVQGRQAGQTDMAPAMGYLTQAGQTGAGGQAGQQALMGFLGSGGEGGGGFSYGGPGADVGNARALTMQSLESAMSGPERLQLAQEAYDQFVERSNPQFAQDQRALAQRSAALGRAGSGMVNSEFADLGTARERELSLARRELSTQAADKTLQDRIARTQLGQSVALGFGDSDRSDASLNFAGAQLGEQSAARRDANRMGAANSLMGWDLDNRGMLRGIATDVFGMGAQNTAERGRDMDRLTDTDMFNTGVGERRAQFQYGADRDAYDRAVNERDSQRGDEFNRDDAGMRRMLGLSGIQENQRGYERSNRNEMRGERDFQVGMEDQAFQRALEQQQFNEWLRNSGWGRTMGAAGVGY